jgi:hypothetical protein
VLVFATVYVFGIMRGVGAESLSLFFTLLHLQTHIGVSPSAIRTIHRDMDTQILRYQQEQETKQRQQAKCSLEVCVAADETFFHEMLLVFRDLSSGISLWKKPPRIGGMTPGRCAPNVGCGRWE